MYVDDIIITDNFATLIQQITLKLNHVFTLKQPEDLDYFIGIEVKRNSNVTLLLTQSKYVRDLFSKTDMSESNSVSTLMASSTKLTKIGLVDFSDQSMYKSIVGALQYALITCHEICFLVNKV